MQQSIQQQNPSVPSTKYLTTKQSHQNYQILVHACKYMRLYLLKKYNQYQFLFEDLIGKQYRVQFGKYVKCTCHQGNLGHCLHSIYVMIKIYLLPQKHQFIYQNQYNEEELKEIIKFAKNLKQVKMVQNKSIIKPKTSVRKVHPKPKQRRGSQKKITDISQIKPKKLLQQAQQQQFPTFDEGTVCPICYDKNDNAVINCNRCRNYYHTKCLKIWIIQKQKQQNTLSCPMCRRQFDENIKEQIDKKAQYYSLFYQSYGIHCKGCMKDILIKIYKCLQCQKYYLCYNCYYKWQHKCHDKFIGKQNKKFNWIVSQRNLFNINKFNAKLQYVKKYGDNYCDMKQLMGNNYQEFINQFIKKPTFLTLIVSCIVDVESQIYKTYKKLDFVQDDIICCLCRKKQIVGMKRMGCKHFIDQKCLKFLLKSNIYQCPIDKKYILPGLSDICLKIK